MSKCLIFKLEADNAKWLFSKFLVKLCLNYIKFLGKYFLKSSFMNNIISPFMNNNSHLKVLINLTFLRTKVAYELLKYLERSLCN